MKRVLVGVLLVAGVLGSGGYAYAQTRDPGPSYRTATARTGDVQRTLELSGTVSATGRRDLSFGTSGSVRSVAVRAGQQVRKGQVLARLDPTSLDAQVTSAKASLAKARAQLASDQDAQSSTVSAAASTSTTSTTKKKTSRPASSSNQGSGTGAGTGKPTTDPTLQQALAQLAKEQQAVTGAQSAASSAISDAKDALAAQVTACKQQDSGSDGGSGDGSGAGSGDGSGAGSGGISTACSNALVAVQAAQQTVSEKLDAVQAAVDALSGTLIKAAGELETSAQSSEGTQGGTQGSSQASSQGKSQGKSQASSQDKSQASSQSRQPSGSGSGSGATGSTSGSGRTVTAATLAQDQAQIDTAKADLTEARAARALATLRAPYAGRIVQRSIASNDRVSASTSAFVLVGKGVTEVSAALSSTQVGDVHRGQQVTVTPAGWTSSLTGTVSQVGLLADSSGSHTLSVTAESQRTVAEGSTASLAIVIGTARHVVTVPTSAVTKAGSRAVVQVLRGSTVTRTVVTLGIVGARQTSIASGLRTGAKVVIADLDASLPAANSNANNRRGNFGGGELGEGPGGVRVDVQRGG